ncbi:DUF4365 domain-containing protein [Vibrio parahaemolyticus]|nr:DUF4365 domain-containing protein [Vibrio parahaemolyticus]
MAKQSESQKIGSKGETLVKSILQFEDWIARSQEEDFGLDLEAEIAKGEVQGEFLKIQVKTKERVERINGACKVLLPRTLVQYADICKVPVILVVVDLSTKQAYYLWVQRWILEQRSQGLKIADLPESKSIQISEEYSLINGLSGELIDIAKGKTYEQLVIGINDLIKTSDSVQNIYAMGTLVDLIMRLNVNLRYLPINTIIDYCVKYSSKSDFDPILDKVPTLLFTLCRRFGEELSQDNILKIVIRADGVSSIGIDALCILYENHFSHMSKLNLPEEFKKLQLGTVSYLCSLMELHPNTELSDIINSYERTVIDGIFLHEQIKDDYLHKFPTAGVSVITRYICLV